MNITVFKAILTDAPIAISASLNGVWRGWKNGL